MRGLAGYTITLVIGDHHQTCLAAPDERQHVDIGTEIQFLEIGGALFVAGDGAVTADNQVLQLFG